MAAQIHTDVLIVGAGIAGLMAANTLVKSGVRVTVVERRAHVGGRLATHALGPGKADTGAQFFTVRSPEFGGWVSQWLESGLVYQWSLGWSDGSLGATPPDGHPRYAVRGGMTALAEHLAQDIEIRCDTRLVSITPSAGSWEAHDDSGSTYTASALLLTPPVPLALELLDVQQVPLSAVDRAALERIEYGPSLAGIFWMAGDVRLPDPGAIQRPNAAITWIADNRRKGISPDASVITVHAGSEYSRQLWSLPDWEVLVALESSLRLYKDYNAHTVEARLERWPHATPMSQHPERCLIARDLPPLVFAGDAFGTPRVEGAALSGLSAGTALAAHAS
jgi:predicted NAD/FAD-dependent oxidoreductase